MEYNKYMEKFKFVLFWIISLTVVGVLAYWAIVTIQSGTEYVAEQKIKQLEKENKNLEKETVELKSKLAILEKNNPTEVGKESELVASEPKLSTTTSTSPTSGTTVYKNQTLIDELEKLVASNIILKSKSQGASVGTLQRFLNVYNKTSTKVDNDYGAGTADAVKAFQKDQGLSSDGEAGGGTFKKMIDWLKKQG